MFYKIATILGAMFLSLHPSDLYSMEDQDKFKPEDAVFSQKSTLKTWLAGRHLNDPDQLDEIQKNVAMEVPQNPYSFNFVRPVENDKGESGYFGKCFYALEAIQLPFLQAVHQLSQIKQPVVLELAAGIGAASWKIFYALEDGGKIYINELSSIMVERINKVLEMRIASDMREQATIIPGDCFDILTKNPELREAVDLIYVQQLEHFFNPIQHQEFIGLISSLLAPGGKAFLTAHTVNPSNIKVGHPVYELYVKEKAAGSMYPGFMTCEGTLLIDLASSAQVGEIEISKAHRPDDAEKCLTKTLSKGDIEIVIVGGMGPRRVQSGCQQVTDNFYTPTIYRNAIAPHQSLTVLESFFMNVQGKRFEKFSDDITMHFASVILEKKAE